MLVEYAEDGTAAAESAAAPDGVDGDAVVVHRNYLLFTFYARILALARCQFARTEHLEVSSRPAHGNRFLGQRAYHCQHVGCGGFGE